MNIHIAFVRFSFHPIIKMWPECLFLTAVVSMYAYKIPFKSFSDWDHLRRRMAGHVVPLTVIVSCINKIHTFLRENQYNYQEKTKNKKHHLTLFNLLHIYQNVLGTTLAPPSPSPTKPHEKREQKDHEFSFNKLCLNKCFGVFIQCSRRLQEAWVTDHGIWCPAPSLTFHQMAGKGVHRQRREWDGSGRQAVCLVARLF